MSRLNSVLTRATGIAERELLGRPDKLLAVIASEDRGWVSSSLARAVDGESVIGDIRIIVPQGPRAYEILLEPLAGQGALMVCRNITRERELMSVFRAQARKDVAELALLAGSMAHDVNDELTVVASALDTFPRLHGAAAEAVLEAEKSLAATRRITQDLLHLGRRDGVEHGPVNLGTLLERVVERLADASPNGVAVRCDNRLGTARVVADPSGIIKMIHQLGVNALRALGLSGLLEFRAHELDGEAILDVEDDGIGIPAAVIPQLFKPFSGQDPERRRMGLALVRGLVQSYGGDIQVQSSAQSGTLFRITLPIYEKATTAPPDAMAVVDELPGTVLLVEDNQAVLNSLAALLGSHDVIVHKAADGMEALRMVDNIDGLELVLLDIGMPGLSGDEVLQRLKHRHPDLPVLMMSGFAREEKVKACLEAGAMGFVGKPFRLAELRQALRGEDMS
ncbi:MAG: response regulator [Proteobacteria bacterium]|nr:response regulator [Pseudomonadota bacterium]MCP4920690.1 response regulator [Pseudomonadota bacterium]